MDPITIASAVGTAFSVASRAWTVGQDLYQFFQNARNVEHTAQAFANEVVALGSACGAVGKRLQEISSSEDQQESRSSLNESAETWRCLRSQLEACDLTVNGLKDVVSSITATSDSSRTHNFIASALKQIKINMRAADIAQARNTIQSHTASLQIVLQAFAIDMIYVTPKRVDQNLQAQLAELVAKRQDLEGLRANRSDETPEHHQVGTEENILRASEKVLSSGETLYTASVAGLSMIGDIIPGKSMFVQDWIHHTNALEDVASETSVNDSAWNLSDATSPIGLASQTEGTVYSDDIPRVADDGDAEDSNDKYEATAELDSAEEFNMEAATAANAEGRSLFNAKDYAAADSTLQEGLRMIRELPIRHQALADPCDIRFMLGVCAFHIQQPPMAEEALLSVVENTPKARIQNEARRLQVLDAGHLLAVTSLRLGKLDQARIYCDSTMQGRRKLFGKNDPSTLESLALMARILEFQGNTSRSKIFVSMLPQERKSDLIRQFSDLSVQDSPVSQSATSPASTPQSPSTIASASQPQSLREMAPVPNKEPADVYHENAVAAAVIESQKSVQRTPTKGRGDYQPPPIAGPVERERRWTFLVDMGHFDKILYGSQQSLVPMISRSREQSGFFSRTQRKTREVSGSDRVLVRTETLDLAALFGDFNIVMDTAVSSQLNAPVRWDASGFACPLPLHYAAVGGYAEIVNAIIRAGANVDAVSPKWGSPLGIAVLLEHLDIVDMLLQNGAHLNTVWSNSPSSSPLSLACVTLNTHLFENLSSYPGCDLTGRHTMKLDRLCQLRKLRYGRSGIPKWYGAVLFTEREIGVKFRISSIRAGLMGIAAFFGHAAAIQLLSQRGASFNDTCSLPFEGGGSHSVAACEFSPMTFAALAGSDTAIKMLLQCGASIPEWQTTNRGRTDRQYDDPLMQAIRNRHERCAIVLLEHGAQIHGWDLSWAAKEGMTGVVEKAKEMRERRPASASDWMTLYIQIYPDFSEARTVTVYARGDESLRDLKLRIQDCARLSSTRKMHCSFFNLKLDDDGRTIGSYGIFEGSKIRVGK